LSLPGDGPTRPGGRGPARLRGKPHSRERDKAAIQYHYDVGNEFYGLWLDRNRQYSCGYFARRGDDLHTAQERKMEHICRKLRLKPGERLLDIGCGWGGLVLYAAQHYGVSALGVTLSENQVAYANQQIARAGLADRVRVALQDYRDVAEGSLDKIVSVGMFEHVGRSHLPEYFAGAYRLLKPGGLFLNHGISSSVPKVGAATARQGVSMWRATTPLLQAFVQRWIVGAGSFVQHYVFPDGELVTVSEANLVAEGAGFEVRDVENLREHYALTLRHWVDRLEAHRDEAIRLAGEVAYRTWRLFMAVSAYQFEAGAISVNQSLLARPAAGELDLPLTRADLYA
jgi:cyclopropane-fatty-acyl-phospholipid synthase